MTKKGYKKTPEHIRKVHTKETHRKLSKSLRKYYAEHPKPNNSPETRRRISEGLKQYYQTHPSHWLGRKQSKATIRKRTKSLKQYYSTHKVWNKGLHWTDEVKEKISEGCLNSSIGMGPKGEFEEVGQE